MDYRNIIRYLLESSGMDPDGALVGAIGAVVAVINKVNGYSFRSSLVVIMSGMILTGYAHPVLVERWALSPKTVYLAMFLLGYVSHEFYRHLQQSAPTLFALGIEYIKKKWTPRK